MGPTRSCMFLLVMFVQLQLILGKPFLTDLLCDIICDDDDDVSATRANSDEDDWDIFGLCACGTRRPPGQRRPGQGFAPNFNLRLPPSANGMNFSLSNAGGLWNLNLDAGPGQSVNNFPMAPNVVNRPIGILPIGSTTFPPTVTIGGLTTAGGATTVAASTTK